MANLWSVLLGGVLTLVGGVLAPVLQVRSARHDRDRQRKVDHFERVRAFDMETIVTLRIALDALADFFVFPVGATLLEIEHGNPNGRSFEALNVIQQMKDPQELSTILNPAVRASAQLSDEQLRTRVDAFIASAKELALVSYEAVAASARAVRDEQAAIEAVLGKSYRQLVRALPPKELGDVRKIEGR